MGDKATGAKSGDLLSSWKAERPDLELSNFLLGIVVQRTGRMLEAWFDRLCRANYDISGPDMRVLFALRRNGAPYALRPTDLFRSLLVTSGAITKQVDRLQAAGLVARQPDAEYAGGFRIRLTPKGLAMADEATERMVTESLLGEALHLLTPEEQASGGKFLYRLLSALEQAAGLQKPALPPLDIDQAP